MIVSFQGYNKKKKELDNYKKSIYQVIDNFILNDENFMKDHHYTPIRDYKHSFDFYKDQKDIFVVQYQYSKENNPTFIRQHEVRLKPEEYERLKEFMKDPDLHININKYNL
jgi:hypothetical protein